MPSASAAIPSKDIPAFVEWQILHERFGHALACGDLSQAEVLAKQEKRYVLHQLGAHRVLLGVSLYDHGLVACRVQEYAKAASLFRQSMDASARGLPGTVEIYADAGVQCARCLMAQGANEEAERELQLPLRALLEFLRDRPKEPNASLALLEVRSTLGGLLMNRKANEHAAAQFSIGEKAAAELFGSKSNQALSWTLAKAKADLALGQVERSESAMLWCRDTVTLETGVGLDLFVRATMELVSLCREQGRWEEGRDFGQSALAKPLTFTRELSRALKRTYRTSRKTEGVWNLLGERSQQIVAHRHNLMCRLIEEGIAGGKLSDSEIFALQLKEEAEAIFGAESEQALTGWQAQRKVAYERLDLSGAATAQAKVAAITLLREGEGEDYAVAINDLAYLLSSELGRHHEALPLATKAYHLYRGFHCEDVNLIAHNFETLSGIHYGLKDKTKSLAYRTEAVGVLSRLTGNGSEAVIKARTLRAESLLAFGEEAEARQELQIVFDQCSEDSKHLLVYRLWASGLLGRYYVHDGKHQAAGEILIPLEPLFERIETRLLEQDEDPETEQYRRYALPVASSMFAVAEYYGRIAGMTDDQEEFWATMERTFALIERGVLLLDLTGNTYTELCSVMLESAEALGSQLLKRRGDPDEWQEKLESLLEKRKRINKTLGLSQRES